MTRTPRLGSSGVPAWLAVAGAFAAALWSAAAPLADAGTLRLDLVTLSGLGTAAAFAAASTGVAFVICGRSVAARIAGLVVLALAAAASALEHPLFADTRPGGWLWARLAHHGWIDRATAQTLLVAALPLLMPVRSVTAALRHGTETFAASVLLAVGAIRLASAVGEPAFTWDLLAGMPLPAAVASLCLGLAVLGGRTVDLDVPPSRWRRLPVTVAIVLAAISCVAWRSLAAERGRPATALASREMRVLAERIRGEIDRQMRGLQQIARVPATDSVPWAAAAHRELDATPACAAIAFVTPALETTVEVGADPRRRRRIDLRAQPAGRALARAARAGTPIVSSPVPLDVADEAVLLIVPVAPPRRARGFVVAAVRVHELFTPLADGRRLGLEIAAGDRALYRAGPPRPRNLQLDPVAVALPGAEWRLRAWREGTSLVPQGSALPEIAAGLGLCVALLAGGAVQLGADGSRRAKAARRVNHDLRQEIEHRRQIERELAAARDAALEAAQAKSAFLATVSHEIRTPMNGVIGMVSLLLETPLLAEQREYADQIRRSADSLVTIINDILDFSKIEAGKLHLEAVEFDPRAVAHDAIDVVAPLAQARALELVCDVEPAVPAVLRGDPSRFRQMLLNLLGNAVKFTESGSVRASIALETTTADEVMVRVTIADTGIGIGRDAITRLFAPFSQADGSMTRRYGGTGLGLAITRQLAELMGGRVGVESAEGRGSAFWFTVRLGRVETAGQTAASPLAGLRLVLADDHPVSLRVLHDDLTALGATVDPAATPEELFRLASLSPHGPQLAIVDDSLPLHGGTMAIEAARRLAKLPPLAAVLLTVRSRAEGVAQARRLGFAGCIVKPARRQQIADVIVAALGASASAPPTTAPEQTRPAGRSLRVLVAEDNDVNQKVVVRMLERLGHRPGLAGNGREALAAIGSATYDLVLMDCQMPEMDGFEATRKIRELTSRRRYLPILALTANASEADRQRCLDAGMDGHLAKPLKLQRLAEALAEWTTPIAAREERRPA